MIEQVMDLRPQAEEVTQLGFDYSQVEEGIRDEVQQAARTIHQLSKGVVDGIVAIGKRLIEVKGMIPHGQFVAWVEGEFDLSERMAQNYMNVARRYADPQNRNNISLFSPTVAYLLAAPSTPEEARQEVEQRAAAGEKITVAATNETIARHKPAAKTAEKAVAEFAPPQPPKARPEPVRTAPVRELEVAVHGWVATAIGEGGVPDAETVLSNLKWQCHEPLRPGGWYDLLSQWLDERNIHFEISDLHRAIADALQHRRQDKARAEARVVYTEETKGEPASVVPDALTAAGYVFRKGQMGSWSWYRTLPGGHTSAGPFESQEAAIASAQNHLGQWITHTLARHVQPDNADYQTALGIATREQLVDALCSLSTEDKHATERQAALQAQLAAGGRLQAAGPEGEIPASSQQLTASSQSEALIGLIISPTADITTTLPNSLHWAVRQATDEQVVEALRRLPDDLRKSRGPVLEYALRKRGVTVEPRPGPDPRLAQAREGIAMIEAARAWVRAHYHDLTGCDTDTLGYFRDGEKMVGRLQSLVDVLVGKP